VRCLVLLALLVAGCSQQQAAAPTLDNAIGRMEDTVLVPMRAFEAEKPKGCNSKNLGEAEGAATYAVNVMTPATHTLSGAMAAGDWMLQVADAARRAGCKDVARRLYERVLQIYVGFVYSSLRERAVVGIGDLSTSAASTAQYRLTFSPRRLP
jgi:hypothetical protein